MRTNVFIIGAFAAAMALSASYVLLEPLISEPYTSRDLVLFVCAVDGAALLAFLVAAALATVILGRP